jgi:uncharacterized surface protein with fasciclin (FAS1) repeats
MKAKFVTLFAVILMLMSLAIGVTGAQDQSIVDIAAGNEDFSTLVSLVQAADLVDVLSGELDPSLNFTVFAPTNAAFEQLPQEVVDALLADTALLTRVLTYHVSLEVYTSEDLTELATVDSIQMAEKMGAVLPNSDLTITAKLNGDLAVNTSNIIAADIMASNGVIHVIDKVLVPADIAEMIAPMMAPAPTQNIVEIAAGNENFSTLVELVLAADLADVLASPDFNFTVFAPTNAAFAKLPAEVLEAVAADPELLTRILSYHVVQGVYTAADLSGASEVGAIQMAEKMGAILPDSDLSIGVKLTGDLTVNNADVVAADIMATNGVVHVINEVLVPADILESIAGMLPEAPTMTIAEIAAGNPDFSTLVELVVAADLADVLGSNDFEFTVFAPTNAAFAALPPEVVEAVTSDPALLTQVLSYHVVQGRYTAADLIGLPGLPSIQMETKLGAILPDNALTLVADDMGGLMVNDSTVVAADIAASNGVIHVIDTILVPPSVLAALAGE